MLYAMLYQYIEEVMKYALAVLFSASLLASAWNKSKAKHPAYTNAAQEKYRRTSVCHSFTRSLYGMLSIAMIVKKFYSDSAVEAVLTMVILTGTLLVTYNYVRVLILNMEYDNLPEPSTEDAHPPPKGA